MNPNLLEAPAGAQGSTEAPATITIPDAVDSLVSTPPPTLKVKRVHCPFVLHKKTPYLARRGKPNSRCKADGTPGDPVPFGSWYVYKTIGGVFYRFSLETEVYDEAKQKYDKWLANLNTTIPTEGSLSSLVSDFLQRRQNVRKGKASKEALDDAVNRLLEWCAFMKVPYKELNNAMILAEWNALSQPGSRPLPNGEVTSHVAYKGNTLVSSHWVLRRLINLAVKKRFIPIDHDLLADVLVEERDNHCPRCVVDLTHEMFQKIRWHMYNDGSSRRHPHTPIVFDLYWMSGGRVSSVANILTEDVNFETGWLFFRVAKYRPNGYRVPMSYDLRLLLKEHIARYDKMPGQKILDITDINRSIAAACKAAGWVHMHAHDFRHLFAVHAMERNVSIPKIALWLGHQDGGVLALQVYGTVRDPESQKTMQENMTFVARTWSADGLSLMRTNIPHKLNDIANQIAAAPTQADVEKLLFNLKDLVENPISATSTETSRVLAEASVMPLQVRQQALEEMVEWIGRNPLLPTGLAEDILESKFPDATPALILAAMRRTADIRRQAIKTANADLHVRMVAYLKAHSDRYSSWLMYDFPEATTVQVKRAILAVYQTTKEVDAKRDLSCPVAKSELRANRAEKRLAAIKAKLVQQEISGDPVSTN